LKRLGVDIVIILKHICRKFFEVIQRWRQTHVPP